MLFISLLQRVIPTLLFVRYYVLEVHTPGIKEMREVGIEVAEDDKAVTITAESAGEAGEAAIMDNLPRKFVIDIHLPKR